MSKFLIIGALPSSLSNFRGQLIKTINKSGYETIAMAHFDTNDDKKLVSALADRNIHFPVNRNGLSPLQDLKTLCSLIKVFRSEKPEVILAYTIKPVIWGGVASRLTRTSRFYALVTGLGYAFQKGGFKKSFLNFIVKNLYRLALKSSEAIIFQNKDNLKVFVDEGIVPESKCHLVSGSGVDLSHFKKEPLPSVPSFLLIARLLGDKGIREYAKAADQVRRRYPNAEFHLVGPEDPSPDGVPASEALAWHKSGVLNYHGATSDVRPFIKECSIFVLPSYHEGMPRTVLEAMAIGRPILTTDVPGCRETVVNGENGWLVEKANVEQLVDKMIWFIENPDQWSVMGDKGYIMATEKFDVHKVNKELMRIMELDDETSC